MDWVLVVIITTISYTANVQTIKIPVLTEELCEEQKIKFMNHGKYDSTIETYCIRVK